MKERLKLLREQLNLTQGEFAEKIGLGQSTWAMIEVGGRALNDRHIKLICGTFDINENWLRTGEGEMLAENEFAFNFGASLNSMSDMEKRIMANYFKLNSDERKAFIETLNKLFGNKLT